MSKVPVVLFVGLIGAGKTTALNCFKEQGAAVISTDDLWRCETYQERNRSRLINALGEDVLLGDGSPNLARLRAILFSLDVKEQVFCQLRLKKLLLEFEDSFFHSLEAEIETKLVSASATMVIVESALGLSNGWDKKLTLSKVVSIHCPEPVRLLRVLERNPAVDKATYLAIMSMQPTDQEHLSMAEKAGALPLNTNCSLEATFTRSHEVYMRLLV